MALLVSRILVTAFVLSVAGFALYRTWTRNIDLLALIRVPGDSIPEKQVRELDLAELANTSRIQEAIIMDIVNDITFFTAQKSEVNRFESRGDFVILLTSAYEDLLSRGILQMTKLASRPMKAPDGKDGALLSNTFLTPKGRSLAEDLLYARAHPELPVSRPTE